MTPKITKEAARVLGVAHYVSVLCVGWVLILDVLHHYVGPKLVLRAAIKDRDPFAVAREAVQH